MQYTTTPRAVLRLTGRKVGLGVVLAIVAGMAVFALARSHGTTVVAGSASTKTCQSSDDASADDDACTADADRLDAVMNTAANRLNALLAPTGTALPSGAWPWEAAVDLNRHAVMVTVDPSQRVKDSAIRAALAEELKTGTVRLRYAPVKPVGAD
jgi:hypothetical protein